MALYNDVKTQFQDIPQEQLSSRVQLLFSLYWEELSAAWRERMDLLRKRDELTIRNEKLVTALKESQQTIVECRLLEEEDRRQLKEVRKEIDKEKVRITEEKKINDRRAAETKRVQGMVQTVNSRIQKKRDEIVVQFYRGY